jgi:hypothetical protein
MAAGTSFPSEDDAADVVTSVITHHAAIGACVKTVQWQQALDSFWQ